MIRGCPKNFRNAALDRFPRQICDHAVAALTVLSRCTLVGLVLVLVMPVIAGLHIVCYFDLCHFFGSYLQLALSPLLWTCPAGAREDRPCPFMGAAVRRPSASASRQLFDAGVSVVHLACHPR